jgi:hypothetical protein
LTLWATYIVVASLKAYEIIDIGGSKNDWKTEGGPDISISWDIIY